MDSTQRFSSRVSDYVRGRPSYPSEIASFLIDKLELQPGSKVVDLGAGTGLSCVPFAAAGLDVLAVEPNEAMRRACEFESVQGTAEATGLPDQFADLVIAGQAFHWFDIAATAKESRRILKPPRNAAVFWNDRDATASPFMRGYEALIERYNTDHARIAHTNLTDDSITAYFGAAGAWALERFSNPLTADMAAFESRVTSSSYMPGIGHPRFVEMVSAIHQLFQEHAGDGLVTLHYTVRLFYGRLTGRA